MSAANLHYLHLLLLAYQRVEHEDEGKEVEVDGQADLEEHDLHCTGGQQCFALALVSTASLCIGQKTNRSPSQLSGRPGLFPLIWQNRMDCCGQLWRKELSWCDRKEFGLRWSSRRRNPASTWTRIRPSRNVHEDILLIRPVGAMMWHPDIRETYEALPVRKEEEVKSGFVPAKQGGGTGGRGEEGGTQKYASRPAAPPPTSPNVSDLSAKCKMLLCPSRLRERVRKRPFY